MKKLEGRMNYLKSETIELLKKEAKFVEFCEEQGYLYELHKQVSGKLTRILIALKNGRLSVTKTEEI